MSACPQSSERVAIIGAGGALMVLLRCRRRDAALAEPDPPP